ncbi:MAG: anion permease, partial [Desulfobacterales bacterium]|nr:anion permease [Desulfobacterales bacterium]
MIFSKKGFQLGLAMLLGIVILLLPRPEGTMFDITGDPDKILFNEISQHFTVVDNGQQNNSTYRVKVIDPKGGHANSDALKKLAEDLKLTDIEITYVDGLSPKSKRFLAILIFLVVLFVLEPVPLEITAICIGVFLVIMGVSDVKDAWAPYMNPVVVFIMCCLIFAISLEKAGLTKRLGYFIIRKAGTNITKFTFVLAISLGYASTFMHDAAACAIGIVTILPLMRAAGIEPHSNTAKFMMLSIPFATSCGGMGTLMGGGRCMVAAAFLKELTGVEITFLDWMIYNLPLALILVPISVCVVYLVFRPDPKINLPEFDEVIGPLSPFEKKTIIIILITLVFWLTKEIHGIHYSVTGMLGVAALVLSGTLTWDDINEHLEWGTALFIFG